MSNEGRKNDLVGTLDFETDPFLAGRIPRPFAACLYFAKDDFILLWDTDSRNNFIRRVVIALRKLPPCVLYAHNGGRFDFHYLIDEAEPQMLQVRNGRLTSLKIGNVTLKDSFPLMPFALEEYRKTKIDYSLFEKNRRNKPANRKKITDYLIDDCANLLELLTGFRAVVGPRDTIASAAFFQMRAMDYPIQSLNEAHDEMFRPYYFGGRVEAFKKGIFNGRYLFLDINSQYPFAMSHGHAHGSEYVLTDRLPRKLNTQFIRCIADSRGALPLRAENGDLSFPHGRAEFFATGWEIAAGLETKTLKLESILEVWTPQTLINFRDYVDTFFAKRSNAKKNGDKISALAYKYLLNSAYGKFAQNPRDFKEYCIAKYGKHVRGFDWENDFGAVSLWSRPSYHGWGFFDVATSASITGFARALLWRAVTASRDVLYCDTDSMICKSSRVPLGAKLGQWKLEGIVKRAAIAGKKLYGVEWKTPDERGISHKIASKGARLSWREVLDCCRGKSIIWRNEAPTFTLGNTHFISRSIRAT